MSELAHFVVEEYEQGNVAAFMGLFPAVESTLQIPDKELQNLIWVGLFESIQNVASHHSFEADVFCTWLGPQAWSPGMK
jgi:hypothetical protein